MSIDQPPAQLRITGADVGTVMLLLSEKEKTLQELSKQLEKLNSTVEKQIRLIQELRRSTQKRQHIRNDQHRTAALRNRFNGLKEDGEEENNIDQDIQMEDTTEEERHHAPTKKINRPNKGKHLPTLPEYIKAKK